MLALRWWRVGGSIVDVGVSGTLKEEEEVGVDGVVVGSGMNDD